MELLQLQVFILNKNSERSYLHYHTFRDKKTINQSINQFVEARAGTAEYISVAVCTNIMH